MLTIPSKIGFSLNDVLCNVKYLTRKDKEYVLPRLSGRQIVINLHT
jgi:hypothetical protein